MLALATVASLAAYKISHPREGFPINVENLIHGLAFGNVLCAAHNLLYFNFVACMVNAAAAAILFSTSTLLEQFAQGMFPTTDMV